jgi:Ca2+/Na+ antiporter
MNKEKVKNNIMRYGKFVLNLALLFIAIIVAFRIASIFVKIILWVAILMFLIRIFTKAKCRYKEKMKREKFGNIETKEDKHV